MRTRGQMQTETSVVDKAFTVPSKLQLILGYLFAQH